MKKLLSILSCVLFVCTITARAAVDNVRASATLVTTAAATNTYVVRGVVEGVNITCPSTKTCTVSIVTASGLTLYSKSGITTATDGYTPIRWPMYSPAGTILSDSGSTNVYGAVAIAEAVTFTITPAADTTGTNSYTAELIVNK